MRLIVGVDIGGTNVVVGTIKEDGSAVYGIKKERTLTGDGADAVVTQVAQMVDHSLSDTRSALGATTVDVSGVGIGAPGPLSTKTGVVHLTPNLGWRNFPLRDRVSEAVGLPATLDNDANCAIFGEWWQGAAKGANTVVGLTIGTGIGGGIILDGKIHHGASDIAGEIGHMSIDSTGRRCKCGNYGCIEAYASGTAIADRAIEGFEAGAMSRLAEYVGGDLGSVTAQVVYDAAKDGDEYALEVIKDTSRFLGTCVANLVNIFNPGIVVICGGVTAAGDRLFTPLREEVKRRAFRPAVESCQILAGQLPGTAGVFGAAAAFKVQTWGICVNRLGIIGTMVWDTIHGRGDSAAPVEEWGGIAYALAALEASLASDWEIVPLIKVGRDLAPTANEFLRTLTHRSAAARFIEVPEANNRVTLRYTPDLRRAEHLSGGVPPWEWHELEPLIQDLDALYVNFISGFETTLDPIRRVRSVFQGPMYVDLHSLFLAVQQDGLRTPQRLPDISEWFSCFDVVQINEDELKLIGEDPMEVAAGAMAHGVQLFIVTLAEHGAVFFTTGGFDFRGARQHLRPAPEPIRTAKVDPVSVEVRDPTGCGDVFGGALVGQLVRGDDVEIAVRAANAAAARNVQYRGATDLQYHLRGEIVPT